MAEEFAEHVQGNLQAGDTIDTSVQFGLPPLVKSGTDYALLELGDNGGLKVDIVDASGIQFDIDFAQYLDGTAISATPDELGVVFMGSDGSNLRFVNVDASGYVSVNVQNTVTVTASDLDIRDLSHTTDSVAIGDGTDTLDVNADGSINVVTTRANEVWEYGSTNLVKDTPTTVKSFSPGSTLKVEGIVLSGRGYALWNVKFGTTSSEATIATFWTTPSDTTRMFEFQESIFVDSGETFLIEGENKETAASPATDFTGYATIIRSA